MWTSKCLADMCFWYIILVSTFELQDCKPLNNSCISSWHLPVTLWVVLCNAGQYLIEQTACAGPWAPGGIGRRRSRLGWALSTLMTSSPPHVWKTTLSISSVVQKQKRPLFLPITFSWVPVRGLRYVSSTIRLI